MAATKLRPACYEAQLVEDVPVPGDARRNFPKGSIVTVRPTFWDRDGGKFPTLVEDWSIVEHDTLRAVVRGVPGAKLRGFGCPNGRRDLWPSPPPSLEVARIAEIAEASEGDSPPTERAPKVRVSAPALSDRRIVEFLEADHGRLHEAFALVESGEAMTVRAAVALLAEAAK